MVTSIHKPTEITKIPEKFRNIIFSGTTFSKKIFGKLFSKKFFGKFFFEKFFRKTFSENSGKKYIAEFFRKFRIFRSGTYWKFIIKVLAISIPHFRRIGFTLSRYLQVVPEKIIFRNFSGNSG